MRENLFFKTDVLPDEIPLLYTNKNLYNNFNKEYISKLLEKENLLPKNKKGSQFNSYTTVPYYFSIPKNDRKKRKMALLHPIAQLQMFSYILRYDQLIVSYAKKSNYSVRSPIIRNRPVHDMTKSSKAYFTRMEQEFSFSKETEITTEEDQSLFYSYFSYKPYKRMQQLYDSNKFNRQKYKYQYFMKFDVQNFFPSIYTHALSWAIFGDKSLAKKLKSINEAFANATDIICQKINFNETNGIVVGPEFSRVVAELLMVAIDVEVERSLDAQGLSLNKDYNLYRFVDDYFLFTHNKEQAFKIERTIENSLEMYNLKMNASKSELQERPFEMVDGSIVELKNAIKLFRLNYKRYSEQPGINGVKMYRKWLSRLWQDLFNTLELIITKYPNSKNRIVNYFLKTARSLIVSIDVLNKFNVAEILELVSNIFTLSINTSNTSSLIGLYIKIQNNINKSEDNMDKEYLNEKVFQYVYSILKNNINDIEQMFDLIIYLRTLEKRLASSFLCNLIEHCKDSYFLMCSIAYYILDDDRKGVLNSYKTPKKMLQTLVLDRVENYVSKGSQYLLLESEYFYLINDFYYYPGFDSRIKDKLKKTIVRNKKQMNFSNLPSNSADNLKDVMSIHANIFEEIMKGPYFNWNMNTKTFLRETARKTIIQSMNKATSYN
ncbi:Reverse transcriptase (RNA-dependent DNA polymerase) [Terribacillus halophilus]|uniref:Reverse transcriptase (RNA-dependent DNA polymerase) n=1 Tax=Terribacillus halophilus TaxID=361279 RepID=A0A1G6T728_9BACI|nr:RNA-directed DNA polymerase [Terribacillus halophilus]SDD24366.1 Reverse transcriptase (RNA-dependent DNA polymerase) [Terribacillus halophilus]